MKYAKFFLLILLVPNLIYATFYSSDLAKVMEKIHGELKQRETLIQEFNRLNPNGREQGLHLLSEAIGCCQRAIDHCDYILKKIANKPKAERQQEFWVYIKNQRNQDKNNLNAEINALQNGMNAVVQDAVFRKAAFLYQESEKKAALATQLTQEFLTSLNDDEKAVSILRELAQIYGEALSLAQQSFNLIASSPDEASKNTLRQVIEIYQGTISKLEKDASEWPAAFEAYENLLMSSSL